MDQFFRLVLHTFLWGPRWAREIERAALVARQWPLRDQLTPLEQSQLRLALVRQRELANILALFAAPIALGLFLLTMPRWLGGTMAFLSLWLFFYGLVLFRRLPALDGATAEAIDEPGVIRPFDDVPLYIRPNDIMDSEDLDELIREQQERRLREPGD